MGSRGASDARIELLAMLGDLIGLATSGQLREQIAVIRAERDELAQARAAFETAKADARGLSPISID